MSNKIALVSDFDGTISADDFFSYASRAYLKKEGLNPWLEYLSGKKSHFESLREMYAAIRVPLKSLHKLIDRTKIDKYLVKVCKLCQRRKIPIYICSAGNDYYIKRLIFPIIVKFKITLITNRGEYTPQTGLQMIAPPPDNYYYDENTGISKERLVKKLKDQGHFVIFAGDGPPDFAPAQIADAVFARKILLQRCIDAQIAAHSFNNFNDIYKFIIRASCDRHS
jgi:2,3-diketo-5-methylthio-1-phosphopentane phosphatase